MQANDPQNTATRDQIQMHLSHIARMFAEGNFRASMLIHDEIPQACPPCNASKRSCLMNSKKQIAVGVCESLPVMQKR